MFYNALMEREPLFEVARRRFDAPEFRGIEFIQSEAKTVINRVTSNFLPFNWTINPYRGCLHSCRYCQAGDTPILLGDGRTKSLAEIVVGDEIYGTVRDGAYRRYVRTRVLAHWMTRKEALSGHPGGRDRTRRERGSQIPLEQGMETRSEVHTSELQATSPHDQQQADGHGCICTRSEA